VPHAVISEHKPSGHVLRAQITGELDDRSPAMADITAAAVVTG
jgi:hypothetical protein